MKTMMMMMNAKQNKFFAFQTVVFNAAPSVTTSLRNKHNNNTSKLFRISEIFAFKVLNKGRTIYNLS